MNHFAPNANAKPIADGDTVIRWKDCPKCEGRGWFLIQPFMTGGTNGAGGISNMTQCQACVVALEYYASHNNSMEGFILEAI